MCDQGTENGLSSFGSLVEEAGAAAETLMGTYLAGRERV